MEITVVNHPLAQASLAGLRNKLTSAEQFRVHAHTISTILILEATKNLATDSQWVETPIGPAPTKVFRDEIVAVPILRAGLCMQEVMVSLFPRMQVGHIGVFRDEETAEASPYFHKLPEVKGRPVFVLDPMLATGGSASLALSILKKEGATQITLVSVVAAPEGIKLLEANHPEVHLVTAAIDERLNEQKYIVPGLGDFGDRYFGT